MRTAPILALLALSGMPCALPAQVDDLATARAAARGGDLAAAAAAVDRHLAAKPTDERGRFLKGVILSEQGRTNEAFDLFFALTQDHPELAEPYNNIAVIYASRGRVRPGARRARERDPRQPGVRRRVRESRRRLRPPRRARLREIARPRRRQPDGAGEARARARAPGGDPQTSRRQSCGEPGGPAALDSRPLTQPEPTFANPPACSRRLRLRVPGARRRPAGRAQDEPRRDRPRALSRQGAQDRRQLPAVRERRPLQRHHLSPRHRRLHDPGRRASTRTCARSRRPARPSRTKPGTG